ncbi:hypothetical protein HPG69_012840 [Diceros bicornis minor]|uniref:DM9 domain-containing protein n=1 Tax=Diceros bicornis minor TaxID=77932 RepID=A0A7J7F0W8_DICBM|nr:hypothetical protein HPG69_012840 [Diceros bicornis minor]
MTTLTENFLSSAESKPEVYPWPSCPLAFGNQQSRSQHELRNHPIPDLHTGNQLQLEDPCPDDHQQQQQHSDKNWGAKAEDQGVGGSKPLFWRQIRGRLQWFSPAHPRGHR